MVRDFAGEHGRTYAAGDVLRVRCTSKGVVKDREIGEANIETVVTAAHPEPVRPKRSRRNGRTDVAGGHNRPRRQVHQLIPATFAAVRLGRASFAGETGNEWNE